MEEKEKRLREATSSSSSSEAVFKKNIIYCLPAECVHRVVSRR